MTQPTRPARLSSMPGLALVALCVAMLASACGASANAQRDEKSRPGGGVGNGEPNGTPVLAEGAQMRTASGILAADAAPSFGDPGLHVINAWSDGVSPGSMIDVFVDDLDVEAPDGWTQADVDGDGRAEWIAVVRGPECSSDPRLWVVGLDNRIAELDSVCQPLGDCGQTCRVAGLGDVTGDGLADIVVESVVQGAHTDTMLYRVVTTHLGGLVNVVAQPPDSEALARDAVEMTYATSSLGDETGDTVPDLLVDGGLVGSAGAGEHQRERREVWSFDGQQVVRVRATGAPTDVRVFWLYDANDALAADELERARELYGAVVEDPSLRDVTVRNTVETRGAVLQYAAFRLLWLALYTNAPEDEVTRWMTFFETRYPETPYARAAALLLESWSGGAQAACEAVTAELTAGKYSWAPLDDMGYANPVLDGSTLCPAP